LQLLFTVCKFQNHIKMKCVAFAVLSAFALCVEGRFFMPSEHYNIVDKHGVVEISKAHSLYWNPIKADKDPKTILKLFGGWNAFDNATAECTAASTPMSNGAESNIVRDKRNAAEETNALYASRHSLKIKLMAKQESNECSHLSCVMNKLNLVNETGYLSKYKIMQNLKEIPSRALKFTAIYATSICFNIFEKNAEAIDRFLRLETIVLEKTNDEAKCARNIEALKCVQKVIAIVENLGFLYRQRMFGMHRRF